MPSGMGSDFGQTTGKSIASILMARLPYTYRLVDDISALNPKFKEFHDLTKRKEERIMQQSVSQQAQSMVDISASGIVINKDYHTYMYAGIDVDKIRRLQQYRRMAAYAEVADAIDEICDECIVKDKEGNILKFTLTGKYDDDVKKEIKKEWDTYVNIYRLEDKGFEYFRQFLIDGELYFENIISKNKSDYGILGLVSIPSEIINPVYDNIQNMMIKGYLLRRPNLNPGKKDKEEMVVFDKNQVTYINSGIWNEDRSVRMPYIENCRRAYKQLSLIEDSLVIYYLVRSPERLVFNVEVGNMAPPKAEEYLRKLMMQYWTRKTYSGQDKSISNVYDPQSMLDSFWFAKRQGTEGTTVTSLPGGAQLSSMQEVLMYFVKKLYKTLKVPSGRLNSEDVFKDGAEITREELRFAKFIMRLQRQFSTGIKESFMVHLKLRKLWDQYKIKDHAINIEFNVPTHFMALRQQQLFDIKYQNFTNLSQNEAISKSFALRHYLEYSDEMMAENREWQRKDAALNWELDQIRSAGPDFREQQVSLGAAAAEMGSKAPPALAAATGGFKPEVPPEFGKAPEGLGQPGGVGGAQPPPATEVPATPSPTA